MIVSAIKCDHGTCPALVERDKAEADGWLRIGGGHRGRYRMDLCPHHASIVARELLKQHGKKEAAPVLDEEPGKDATEP